MNELRLELRSRNNVLWHAIFDAYPSVAAFCRAYGFQQTTIGAYLNLSESPYLKDGSVAKTAQRLCDALRALPDDLFPRELYSGLIQSTMTAEVDAHQFVSLASVRKMALPAPQETALLQGDARDEIAAVLSTLSRREEKMLKMYFGLDGEQETSKAEIAASFGVTRSRADQVIQKGLRKLRHPSRSRPLRQSLEDANREAGR